MKLQLAIDRVPLAKAVEIILLTRDYVDIIEVGTSLIKDYGMLSVRELRHVAGDCLLLADMKVIDEGEYEFRAAYENGADLVTLMGGAAMKTIDICNSVAKELGKDYLIDLMEISDEKISEIARTTSGILCFHAPSDTDGGLDSLITHFVSDYKGKKRGALAGGINMNSIASVKEAGFDIAIVGGAITKSDDITAAAKRFREMIL